MKTLKLVHSGSVRAGETQMKALLCKDPEMERDKIIMSKFDKIAHVAHMTFFARTDPLFKGSGKVTWHICALYSSGRDGR